MDKTTISNTAQKYTHIETMIQNLTHERETRDKKLEKSIQNLQLEREKRYKELTAMLYNK